jgi:two-component system, cell cycle sensor histidine kinase and response regulator CckA
VLYMSGYTHNVIAENGTLEEGLSFLQKPFAPLALTQRVRETLDRPVVAAD